MEYEFFCKPDTDLEWHKYWKQKCLDFLKDLGLKEQVLVENTREAYAIMCKNLFGASVDKMTLIGITGTNGKTTTTSLIYHILKKAGYNVGLAGNIGSSLALQVAENNYDYYVIELSSFQAIWHLHFK